MPTPSWYLEMQQGTQKKVVKSLNQRSENHVRHQLGCSEITQVESSIETYGIVVQ